MLFALIFTVQRCSWLYCSFWGYFLGYFVVLLRFVEEEYVLDGLKLITIQRFVKFANAEDAKAAIQQMSGHKIGNKTLLCKLSNKIILADPSANLYVKPLPLDMTKG
jgi:RNA recognition motif. (a.k.a. RRM, RBD, or RNP domain)